MLTPLELIERIAQLVTAMAQVVLPVPVPPAPKTAVIARQKPLAARSVATWRVATRQTRTCGLMDCHGLRPRNDGKPKPRPPSHYLWVALIARIDEVFSLARGPPLWDECGAQEMGEGVEAEPDWYLANQSPPDYPDDQRTTW